MNLINIKKIFEKKATSKIALFIRHGEKDLLNLKNSLSLLTQDAINNAKKIGLEIKSLNIPTKIYTSPELRCVQTAKAINFSLSGMKKEIIITNILGEPGIQIIDNEKYETLYKQYKCREIYDKWKKGYYYDTLQKPQKLKTQAIKFLNETCDFCGLIIYISQSGTIAHLGYALDVINYNVENNEWVTFLDGFFIEIKN